MIFLIYAISLLVCAEVIFIQDYLYEWGHEPELGWEMFVSRAWQLVLWLNLPGFVTLLLLQRRDEWQWLHHILLGGLAGALSGFVTGWLTTQPESFSSSILLFAQAPLILVIVDWLLKRLSERQRL